MELPGFMGRIARADFADAVGVYVCADSVSMALVQKRLNTVRVAAVDCRPLTGPGESRDALITGFTRDFAEKYSVEGARVVIAVSRKDTLLGHFQLPAAAVANLARVVGYEMDRLMPVSVEDIYFDTFHRPVGEDGEKVAVTVVAARRDEVDALRACLAEAGLADAAVTVQPVAANDFLYFCEPDRSGVTGVFTTEGERECMTLSFGGLMVSSHYWNRYAVESREADLRKEIERSLPDQLDAVASVAVDGVGAEGEEELSRILPEGSLSDDIRPSAQELVAIGAALGRLGESRVRINLVPDEMVGGQTGVGLREIGLAALVIVLAIVLTATTGAKNMSTQGAIASEVRRLDPLVSEVTRHEEENRRLVARMLGLEEHRGPSVLNYLRAVTKLIPRTAYLTTFRLKGDRLELDGIADSASGLISVLEKSPLFENVEFTAPTTKYLQRQERFSLRMGLER